MLYLVTFTINIPPMLAYIPYMDPMGMWFSQRYFLDTNMIFLWNLGVFFWISPTAWLALNSRRRGAVFSVVKSLVDHPSTICLEWIQATLIKVGKLEGKSDTVENNLFRDYFPFEILHPKQKIRNFHHQPSPTRLCRHNSPSRTLQTVLHLRLVLRRHALLLRLVRNGLPRLLRLHRGHLLLERPWVEKVACFDVEINSILILCIYIYTHM